MNTTKKYLRELDKTMNEEEKLFFVKQINIHDYDIIVDFGGANGHLLRILKRKYNYRGFRILVEENSRIKTLNDCCEHRCWSVTETIRFLIPQIKRNKKCLIILSSVLHECNFFDLMKVEELTSICDAVVMRDMYFDESTRPITPLSYRSVYLLNKNGARLSPENLICTSTVSYVRTKILTEFLLKYTYIQNREKEEKESYLCNNIGKIANALVQGNYSVCYYRTYTLPYKKRMAKQDFDIDLNWGTHLQIILKIKDPTIKNYRDEYVTGIRPMMKRT